ncbi:MAG: cell wall metabolism sensor histidine kinase WalK [Clostridiales bacterium]|nr:cell wall metabolism sensor histidine kinase WalK [Clostridiales bacterium]
MYRSLYFKIILLFAVFMIAVMAVVGTVLLNSVFSFYMRQFEEQIDRYLSPDSPSGLRSELTSALSDADFARSQKAILTAYSTMLGIDDYRSFYILDMDAKPLAGSDEELPASLTLTENLITAMSGRDGTEVRVGASYADYAGYLTDGSGECIIYVKDSQEEMRSLSWQIFSLILQSIFFGLIIAVVLSFLLAKAITRPIRNLTAGAQAVAAGEFSHEIDVSGSDEIGVLTSTFNDMRITLRSSFDEVSRERTKLETVMSNLKDSVVAFSDTGSVIQINGAAKELLGINDGDNAVLTLPDMLSLLGVSFAGQRIERLGEKGEAGSMTLHEIVYGGKALDITFSRFESESGQSGYITVIHDVTSRYELDKAQREFVANVSHELKTPLTVIKGAAETLAMYPDMRGEMHDTFINNIVEESDRMKRIVDDLLTLSRLDNNRTKWQISEFDLQASLSHLCEILTADAKKHSHKLIYRRTDSIPPILGDKERIEQVVINIISNSIKYTPDGGEIKVWAKCDSSRVYIHVRDNGVGIPEDDIPRLFERFYRVEKSRTTDAGGTGLGLAIAKEIVVAHGGEIGVKSKIGAGTETTVILPIRTTLKNSV